MAETVEQELRRKLEGAISARAEVQHIIEVKQQELSILVTRVDDLQLALSVFEPAKCIVLPRSLFDDDDIYMWF